MTLVINIQKCNFKMNVDVVLCLLDGVSSVRNTCANLPGCLLSYIASTFLRCQTQCADLITFIPISES